MKAACMPTALTHRGSIVAAGLLLAGEWRTLAARRAWLLTRLQPGDAVFAAGDDALVWRWAQPRRVDVNALPGAALLEAQGVLWALPPDARAVPQARAGEVVIAEAGALKVVALGAPQDPSTWLELSTLRLLEVQSLGAEPVPAALPVAAREVTREFFGAGVPPPSPELLALQARARQPTSAPGARPPPRFLAWLSGLLVSSRSQRAVSGAAGPSLLARIVSALSDWATRAVLRTPLGWLLNARNQRYLDKLVDLFDQKDLTEALRHAIPLGGPAAERIRQALLPPTPRSDLRLTSGQIANGTRAVWGADELTFQSLQTMYRRAFEKLEREGRIDEAAFVLAELLFRAEDAVSFLERHGRLRPAAELAEGRKLTTSLVVRQWIVAGDWQRAVDLARQQQAFAPAVAMLERTHPGEAQKLRLVWAEERALAGDWLGAVETAWPIASARPLCAAWVERGLNEGGLPAVSLLAWALALLPQRWASLSVRADALVADDTLVVERFALARAMAGPGPKIAASDATRTVARVLTRALLRDHGLERGREPQLVRSLAQLAGEAALEEEVEALAFPVGQSKPTAPFVREVAPVLGGARVSDLAVLADGRVLVALGEAGVHLYSRTLKLQARFDAPAMKLVVADSGMRALALARRGAAFRVTRLDLGARKAVYWCDAALANWCDTFDGSSWFINERVGSSSRLVMVNPWEDGLRALWHVPDVAAHSMLRTTHALFVLTAREHERFHWELPSLTLRARTVLERPVAAGELVELHGFDDEGAVLLGSSTDAQLNVVLERWAPPGKAVRLALDLPEVRPSVLFSKSGNSSALVGTQADGCVAWAFSDAQRIAELRFAVADDVVMRLSGSQLALADGHGRALLFDTVTREVREFRVR